MMLLVLLLTMLLVPIICCREGYNKLAEQIVRSFVLSGVAVGCWQSFDVPSATASAEA